MKFHIKIAFSVDKGEISRARERLATLPERLDFALKMGTEGGGDDIRSKAMELIPKRKGPGGEKGHKPAVDTIQKGEVVREGDAWKIQVGSEDKIAKILEWGSPEHTIRSRFGHVLRFFVGGQEVERRVVHHPGFTGFRWLERAGHESEASIIARYENEIDRAIRG